MPYVCISRSENGFRKYGFASVYKRRANYRKKFQTEEDFKWHRKRRPRLPSNTALKRGWLYTQLPFERRYGKNSPPTYG